MLSSTARMSDSRAELAEDSSATLLDTAGTTTPLKYTCRHTQNHLQHRQGITSPNTLLQSNWTR
jgi:hypothetical protein